MHCSEMILVCMHTRMDTRMHSCYHLWLQGFCVTFWSLLFVLVKPFTVLVMNRWVIKHQWTPKMALLTQFLKHFLLKYELTSFNCLLSPFVLCSFILFDIGKTDFSVLVLLRSEAVSLLEIKWIMPWSVLSQCCSGFNI